MLAVVWLLFDVGVECTVSSLSHLHLWSLSLELVSSIISAMMGITMQIGVMLDEQNKDP